MARNGLRLNMFGKFLVGCLILATLLIAGGYLVVRSETKMKSRGEYLAKHFKRYINYQDGIGRAVSSVADHEAHDPALRRALTPQVRGTADPISPSKSGDKSSGAEPQTTPPKPAKPTIDRPAATAIMVGVYKVLSAKNSIQPDIVILFDKHRRHVWSSPGSVIEPDDLREIELVNQVSDGSAFFNKVLIHRGAALQIAGIPVRSIDTDEVVGGILIGVRIERYMKQYQEQSDDRPIMQHRLVLVRKDQVVASVFPVQDWRELGEQLKRENWHHLQEGDFGRKVIHLRQGDFDMYEQDIEGFAGLSTGDIGELFLLRSRANLKGRGPTFPGKEIVIGIVLSFLVALLLSFWITRPIKSFVDQSQQILDGETDLTQRIELGSNDETRDLAENINEVFARVYNLATDVQSASFQVGASSSQISAASRQMLDGLRDQTMKIEGSTAAVTELSASIQQVANNATHASQVAEKSNVAVAEAQLRMQQIRHAVEDAADKMGELGESSKRIGNIVEVIRQISEQTSLLALNASIEAAHAGEQGRGFAVVADEVSSLAKRVGQSAKDIESLIQTIKEQTTDAVQSMQVGTREVEGGTELVNNTLSDLKQLIAVVNDTASAVVEQAQVSDEIARNMDAVRQIASEVLEGSEESVGQAEQLHELAFRLEESVGGFNLDASSSGNPSGNSPSASGISGGAFHDDGTLPDRAAQRALPQKTPPRRS